MNFSRIELRDLAISAIVLGFALGGFEGFFQALLIVAIVFLSHEVLGHKLVAQHYGCFAEYRMWPMGLMLALITSFFGFIFAAPGAVYISPVTKQRFAFTVVHLTRREHGLISIAGPALNIAMGIVMLAASIVWPIALFMLAARFSAFLAIFNLLPIPPLDGQKVLEWSKLAWATAIATAACLYIATIIF
ncbi:MAG: site-2 protease family protein [Candidatus Aenigmatarchaeota archaeon]|nr:site-2 protease family protein [Candidatus Aenigmarchaeota archaeon]